jgi:hypothetical protein
MPHEHEQGRCLAEDQEMIEVTCPVCGMTSYFSAIEDTPQQMGAGSFLIQHREFHSYELHTEALARSFDSLSDEEGW